MEYNKPEVVALGSAVDGIQSCIKYMYHVYDALFYPPIGRTNRALSIAAYESDE